MSWVFHASRASPGAGSWRSGHEGAGELAKYRNSILPAKTPPGKRAGDWWLIRRDGLEPNPEAEWGQCESVLPEWVPPSPGPVSRGFLAARRRRISAPARASRRERGVPPQPENRQVPGGCAPDRPPAHCMPAGEGGGGPSPSAFAAALFAARDVYDRVEFLQTAEAAMPSDEGIRL